jgi:hypothetical protein
MFDDIGSFDYFLNIEDDIAISWDVLATCMAFNDASHANEVYLPNRIEMRADGTSDCVDLVADPSWKPSLTRTFRGAVLGVASNPHSGLAFLSQRQMRYAAERVDRRSRNIIVGGFMASAYANLHGPFLLWRARSDYLAHHVVHLDRWLGRPALPGDAPDEVAAVGRRDAIGDAAATGCLDLAVLEGGRLKVAGWATTADGRAATELRLSVDDQDLAG